MAITSRIGRKSWDVRLMFFGMYVFLIFGATTMVYPFLLMLSGSTKSAVDIKYFDAWPRFLRSDLWLYRKHVEGLFNESVSDMNTAYAADEVAFENVTPPTNVNTRLVAEFKEFLDQADLPFYSYTIGYLSARVSRTLPSALRGFKKHVQQQYGDDLDKVNAALQTEFIAWNAFYVDMERSLMRRDKPSDSPFTAALARFKADTPYGMRYYFSPEGHYKKEYLKPLYGLKIDQYNAAHDTTFPSYEAVHLPRTYPAEGTPAERTDWESFVRNTLALQWVRVDASGTDAYRTFLEVKHRSIDTLNERYGTAYDSFGAIPLITEPPLTGMALSDWEAFIAGWHDPETDTTYAAPLDTLRIYSVEFLFRDHLLGKYGSLDGVGVAVHTTYDDILDIALPQEGMHYEHFLTSRGALRWEFVTRNYVTVCDYMLFHGRGIINTVIYCVLAVASALLVNPVAAYAMSRYKLPSSYKILLFLMCTMAFPPMVTAIPNFIMLRRLGLLNTFAALILPGMANGYSIFLLKGFFDAQPQELYESAQLDGAGEWTMFWQITMSLSKPILAVIALSAFTMAYSNFMFAFVVCQDEKMWTLMVWLYQLQQRSGQAVMYASLLIAAIPTFLIFVFCQNIIMRGIVVPSEK